MGWKVDSPSTADAESASSEMPSAQQLLVFHHNSLHSIQPGHQQRAHLRLFVAKGRKNAQVEASAAVAAAAGAIDIFHRQQAYEVSGDFQPDMREAGTGYSCRLISGITQKIQEFVTILDLEQCGEIL